MLRYFVFLFLSALVLSGCSTSYKQLNEDPYVVISSGSDTDVFLFIKYSKRTGKAWILGDEWIPIQDDEELPESNYTIKCDLLYGNKYSAVRLDARSGKSWSSINNHWKEIKTKDKENLDMNGGANE